MKLMIERWLCWEAEWNTMNFCTWKIKAKWFLKKSNQHIYHIKYRPQKSVQTLLRVSGVHCSRSWHYYLFDAILFIDLVEDILPQWRTLVQLMLLIALQWWYYLPYLVQDIIFVCRFKVRCHGVVIDDAHLDANRQNKFVRLLTKKHNPFSTLQEAIIHQVQGMLVTERQQSQYLNLWAGNDIERNLGGFSVINKSFLLDVQTLTKELHAGYVLIY